MAVNVFAAIHSDQGCIFRAIIRRFLVLVFWSYFFNQPLSLISLLLQIRRLRVTHPPVSGWIATLCSRIAKQASIGGQVGVIHKQVVGWHHFPKMRDDLGQGKLTRFKLVLIWLWLTAVKYHQGVRRREVGDEGTL